MFYNKGNLEGRNLRNVKKDRKNKDYYPIGVKAPIPVITTLCIS